MAREAQVLVYVGIKSSALALDARTGDEVWRAPLGGADFTTVLWDGEALFAANYGEVFCLDPRTGAVLWHNELKGLGRGLVSLASARRAEQSTDPDVVAAKRRHDAEAAAAS